MRDPHVVELIYAATGENGVEYREEAVSEHTCLLGSFRVAGGKLHVAPVQHFATTEEARATIDPYLRAWETESDLRVRVGAIRFKYETATVVDRDPPPTGDHPMPLTLRGSAHMMFALTGKLDFKVTLEEYPQPPSNFVLTHEVIAAYERWKRWHEDPQRLTEMANYVLTLVEGRAAAHVASQQLTTAKKKSVSNRQAAASMYAVDFRVLHKIGDLAANRGDSQSSRKYLLTPVPLSDVEAAWLDSAVKLLILRIGEHAAGTPMAKVTLADLPALS
jgi:hypothetical protein